MYSSFFFKKNYPLDSIPHWSDGSHKKPPSLPRSFLMAPYPLPPPLMVYFMHGRAEGQRGVGGGGGLEKAKSEKGGGMIWCAQTLKERPPQKRFFFHFGCFFPDPAKLWQKGKAHIKLERNATKGDKSHKKFNIALIRETSDRLSRARKWRLCLYLSDSRNSFLPNSHFDFAKLLPLSDFIRPLRLCATSRNHLKIHKLSGRKPFLEGR